jgi:hypothetical protein
MVYRHKKLLSRIIIALNYLKIFGNELPPKGHNLKTGLHGTGNIKQLT